MDTVTTSCDPNIEHVIFDCDEVIPFHGNVNLKLVYLEKEGYAGKLIGVTACEKDGTPLEGGLIVILENGKFYRQPLTNPKLDFIAKDAKGRMKILQ